jgi:hypothetical protein
MTYQEYIDFLNHLFMERLTDFEFHNSGSTVDALEVL